MKNFVDKNQSKIVILTGGGTGGHIYPNLALVESLKMRGLSIVYIGGTGDTLERRLALKDGLIYHDIPTIKLVRSLSPKATLNNLKIPFALNRAIAAAKTILRKVQPSAIFSKGGFVSLPVVLAGLKLNIPVFCHESDQTLGLANKLGGKGGATLLLGNPHSTFDGQFVGMPLRAQLFSTSRYVARQKLNIDEQKTILLIVGGSSGASVLNDVVTKNIDKLLEHFFVIHITGKGKSASSDTNGDAKMRANYLSIEYADNIEDYLHASDIVVSRAGATAVFELSALQKKALFVPLPKGISRGDQLFNAELAREYGASVLLQDKDFAENFVNAVMKTASHPAMKVIENDANGKIASILCDSISRGDLCKNKKLSQNG